jgi:hypothetical protein
MPSLRNMTVTTTVTTHIHAEGFESISSYAPRPVDSTVTTTVTRDQHGVIKDLPGLIANATDEANQLVLSQLVPAYADQVGRNA